MARVLFLASRALHRELLLRYFTIFTAKSVSHRPDKLRDDSLDDRLSCRAIPWPRPTWKRMQPSNCGVKAQQKGMSKIQIGDGSMRDHFVDSPNRITLKSLVKGSREGNSEFKTSDNKRVAQFERVKNKVRTSQVGHKGWISVPFPTS